MLRTVTLPDGRELQYTLTRKAVKNINLRLGPEGDLRASASKWVPAGTVDDFVRRSGPELLRRRAEARPRLTAHPAFPEPRDGAPFWLLGSPMTLRLRPGAPSASLAPGALVLTLPDPADREAARRAFRKWHKARCTVLFERMGREAARRAGLEPVPVAVREMKARWGSCHMADKKITLNSRLLAAPEGCILYVVCHEYCHFFHPDHSARFYEKLARLLPDWQSRRAELRAFYPAGEPEEGANHDL